MHVLVYRALAPVQGEVWANVGFLSKVLRRLSIPQGRYTYRGKDKFAGLSLQLRVEPDRRGVMVINANTVLHLNETATVYAYFFMQGISEDAVLNRIRQMYRVNLEKARKDYEELVYTISTLAQTEKVCPTSFLNVGSVEPFTQQFSAPLRVDIALTFRCQNNCVHCYAGGSHETPELSTEEWEEVIDQLSQIGVFILTFTGGEPTLREDLPKLLLYAQNKGMVTGLITNGRRLKDKAYVEILEKTGLDFVQVTLESHKPKIHDQMTMTKGSWKETVAGIKNAIQTQIYVTTNTTLSKHNAPPLLRNHRLSERTWRSSIWVQQPNLLWKSKNFKPRIRDSPRDTKRPSTKNPGKSQPVTIKISLVHPNPILSPRPR